MARVERTGDTKLHHELSGFEHPEKGGNDDNHTTEEPLPPWGWGDGDIPLVHYNITQTLRPTSKAG